MLDYAVQRMNMVEGQVRTSDVTDRRITRAMLEIPREMFVPDALRWAAYLDEDLKLNGFGSFGRGRVLLSPRILALMIQELNIDPEEMVLEVGGATAYGAAVMARLARKVVALEADAAMSEAAKASVSAALTNDEAARIEFVSGALTEGWPDKAPYGAILIAGAVEVVPEELLDQLLDGGRLVAVMVKDGLSRITVWQRHNGSFGERVVKDARVTAVPGFTREHGFTF